MTIKDKISERQSGSRPNRSCVDHMHTLRKTIQGTRQAGLTAYCFYLGVYEVCNTACLHGFRKKPWEMELTGKMWRRKKKNYGMGEKSYDAGRGIISRYVDIFKGFHIEDVG